MKTEIIIDKLRQNDALFIQEIINDLERYGYSRGGKAYQMLRDWSAELRDEAYMNGRRKKEFIKQIGVDNW